MSGARRIPYLAFAFCLALAMSCGRTELDQPVDDSAGAAGSMGPGTAGRGGAGGGGGDAGNGGGATGGSVAGGAGGAGAGGAAGRGGTGGAAGVAGRGGTTGTAGQTGRGGTTGTAGVTGRGGAAGTSPTGRGGIGGGGTTGTAGVTGRGGVAGTSPTGRGGAAGTSPTGRGGIGGGGTTGTGGAALIPCGQTTCVAGVQACCFQMGTARCIQATETCPGGASISCLDGSACSSGDVCCLSLLAGQSTCVAPTVCGFAGGVVLCGSAAECPATAANCCRFGQVGVCRAQGCF